MEEQKTKSRQGGLKLKPWLKPWPIYLIALAVVGGGVYFTRQQREAGHADPILPANVQLQQNIEIQFSDVIMQGRQRGVQRWTITSPKVSLSKDSRYTYFEPNPKGEFYNLKDWSASESPAPGASPSPDGKTRSMTWTAAKAEFDSFTEDLTIQGKAVITTDTKDVIKTEKVEYKSRSKYVMMPKPVDIQTTKGTHVKADSLKANADAEVFELTGHVDMISPVNDEEKL
jgi:LPS export ABC transporter protein LptC